jgi:dolichol-phosphate mannosyltransferase
LPVNCQSLVDRAVSAGGGSGVRTGHGAETSLKGAQAEVTRLGSFLLVGGSSTILNLGIVAFLTSLARWPYVPSAVIAFEIGVLYSFIVMDRLTFRSLARGYDGWVVRCLRFHGVYALGATVTIIAGETLVQSIGWQPTAAHALALVVVTALNFGLLRLWAYRTPRKPSARGAGRAPFPVRQPQRGN